MAATEWRAMGTKFYRKQVVCAMRWDSVDLGGCEVACAPFGGPIAIMSGSSLLTYSGSGLHLASILWQHGCPIAMGWIDNEILVCVSEDGSVFQYNIHGDPFDVPFSLGQGVIDCVIGLHALVYLTGENKIFSARHLRSPQVEKFTDFALDTELHCMVIAESDCPEVFVAASTSVYRVGMDSKRVLEGIHGPVLMMALDAACSSSLCCLTHDLRVVILRTIDCAVLLAFHTEFVFPPKQLAWCGSDSVILYCENTLLMVGPNNCSTQYDYEESLVLVPECDGVRIVSSPCTEFLHLVPESMVSIFGSGSTSPAAMLYDALNHSGLATKAFKNVTTLSEAVDLCIDAAGYEFDTTQQETLLRAAAVGLAFSSLPRKRLDEMGEVLRVLNAVREFGIGAPLSLKQMEKLTKPKLIARLNIADRSLALRIQKNQSLNKIRLLMHKGQNEQALRKAVESGDTDVVYTIIFEIADQQSPAELNRILSAIPRAQKLFVSFTKQNNLQDLEKFFLSTGQHQGVAETLIRQSWEKVREEEPLELSTRRRTLLGKAQRNFALAKKSGFEAKCLEEQLRIS